MNEDDIKKLVKEVIDKRLTDFTIRKLTDTPTEALSLVNRKFVTLSSNLGSRPVSSVAVVGQRFFDTTNNRPIYYTTAGWRDSTSSIVAQNN